MKDEETLDERVTQFTMMKLPGQPMSMHMGTSYLVNDLHKEVKQLRSEQDRLQTALTEITDGFCPDLRTAVEIANKALGREPDE